MSVHCSFHNSIPWFSFGSVFLFRLRLLFSTNDFTVLRGLSNFIAFFLTRSLLQLKISPFSFGFSDVVVVWPHDRIPVAMTKAQVWGEPVLSIWKSWRCCCWLFRWCYILDYRRLAPVLENNFRWLIINDGFSKISFP